MGQVGQPEAMSLSAAYKSLEALEQEFQHDSEIWSVNELNLAMEDDLNAIREEVRCLGEPTPKQAVEVPSVVVSNAMTALAVDLGVGKGGSVVSSDSSDIQTQKMTCAPFLKPSL